MKKYVFRIVVLALSLVMLLGVVACGGETTPPASPGNTGSTGGGTSSSPDSSPADTAPDPVEVTMWFYPLWEADTEQYFGDGIVDLVKAKYPHITLNYEMLSWDSGPEKFTVAMATGATPDLIFDGYSRLAPAVNAGLTADLTDLAATVAPYLPAGMEHTGNVNGQVHSIDWGSDFGYCMTVNTTLCKKLGVYDQLPADKMTWSHADFLKLMRDAKAADPNIYGLPLYAGSRSSDAWYYGWYRNAGSEITKPDFSGMDVVGKPGVIAVLNLFKTMVDEGLTPPGSATATDLDVQGPFISEQCLFTNNGFNMMVAWQKQMDEGEIPTFEMELVALPSPDGTSDVKTTIWGANSYIVFKNNNDAAKIDAAKKVIECIFSSEEFAYGYANRAGLPNFAKGGVPVFDHQFLTDEGAWIADFTAKRASSDFGIREPWWSDFRETHYVELQGVLTGAQTPEQMLINWTATGEAVIAAGRG